MLYAEADGRDVMACTVLVGGFWTSGVGWVQNALGGEQGFDEWVGRFSMSTENVGTAREGSIGWQRRESVLDDLKQIWDDLEVVDWDQSICPSCLGLGAGP